MLSLTEANPGIEPETSDLSSTKDDGWTTRLPRPHITLFGRGIYRKRMVHTTFHSQ